MVVVTLLLVPLITKLSKLPPDVEAIVNTKLSTPSANVSSIVVTLKFAVVWPASMVTVATPV